jgi:very-short-patch-repair endonuclease/endogenous inhibitor of DNA gyrase (YacG/DUF329 family)
MKGRLGYKIRTITCAFCGGTKTDHMNPRQRYCSLACSRGRLKPQRQTGAERSCDTCGKVAYVHAYRLGQERWFCSRACHHVWMGRNKTEHECRICHRTFRWSPSRTRSGHHNVTYCSLACRDVDPTRRDQLIAMNIAQQGCGRTTIERIGYSILDALNVTYLAQHLLAGKFCVDAFLPAEAVVIQFDGDYWHGHPHRFPQPDPRQQRRIKLDHSQDAYLTACGYTVIRLWESDLKADADAILCRLRAQLQPRHGECAPPRSQQSGRPAPGQET